MRKSQRKPVPEDPQGKKEQHQTSDGGASCTEVHDETVPSREFQERPARTVGDLRKIYEPQETKRPQRKNEVCDQDGIICQPYMLFSSVDQNRNVPNQDILGNKIEPQERSEKTPVKSEDPQEKNGEQGRPALTVGALLKIYEPQKTKRPQRKNEPKERNEKTPVKSVKGEQDKEKLQIKIDDLQKTVEYSLDKTEAISATMGDLLKKIDKGENDKYDSQKQIVDLLKKLEKTPKKDDDFQKKFEEMSATIGDLLKKIDKGEQERGILWEKIEKMKQEKDEIAQEKNQIAQEKEVLLHNLEKMKQEKDEIAQEKNEIAQEKEQLKKEIERKKDQFKSVWRDIPLYADWRKEEFQTVNLTLDAATAHPALFLSEEGRRITWQEPCQDLPISPERFASIPCVLGQLHASSGRYFWEVEVQNAHSWDLGVCRNYVERNGRVIMSPQNGFWAIRLYDGQYWGLTYPETSLTLKEKPCRVGVFLDCVAGDVSFYNMKDGSHIYTFSKQTFSGVIRPLFRLWSSDSGPLTIVQVE